MSSCCKIIIILLYTIAVISIGLIGINASEAEHRLFTNLRNGYDALERPVANISTPVVVTLTVFLQQIIQVNMKDEQLTLNCWLQYSWNDEKMKWNPDDYEGINSVRFPYNTLWRPDVLIYNSAADGFDSTYPTNLIVYNSGQVDWIPPGIFLISCKIDITWFPFDEQKCSFKFGSWTYDGSKIDLQSSSDSMDLSSFVINGEWELYKTTAVRSEQYYDCCPAPYLDIRYFMYLKRRTLYYGINMVTPCLIVSLLTVLGFALPSDGCQKITLQITMTLTFCIFLDIVAKMSPPTSETVPLLGVFFSACTVLSAASVSMAVVILNIHHRHPDFYEMGYKTRVLLTYWLPWFVAMERPGKPLKLQTLPRLFPRTREEEAEVMSPWCCCRRRRRKIASTDTPSADLLDDNDSENIEKRINQCYLQLADRKGELDTFMENAVVLIYMAYKKVKRITKGLKDADESGEIANDWTFAAMAIDRLCIYMFTVLISGSTCLVFFNAPYLSVPMTPVEQETTF